ncbi:MAG: metabolite traffic protein EboE, partial [Nitrospiraceae bacterium]
MILPSVGHPHLTYCTNIHPGETWPEVQRNLEQYVLAVKARMAPDRPFGVGLRLSSEAAEDLSKPDVLEAFSHFLQIHNLYVFTINGFPYSRFHGQAVKENVYLPDWLDERRLVYTDRLALLLADLLPSGPMLGNVRGSISTVPGAFKLRMTQEADTERMTELLLRHLTTLHGIRERTGRVIVLALEPEPCCFLETVNETTAFFEGRLFSRHAVNRFSFMTGMTHGESEGFLRRHAAVC